MSITVGLVRIYFGYVILRHNSLRDLFAEILEEVWSVVMSK